MELKQTSKSDRNYEIISNKSGYEHLWQQDAPFFCPQSSVNIVLSAFCHFTKYPFKRHLNIPSNAHLPSPLKKKGK